MSVTGPDETLAAQGWRRRELPGYIGLVGPLWTRREDEGWSYGLLAGERHLNPAGVVHGGALASLLDHVLSTVAWEASGRVPCVTVQLNTQFLRSVRAGQWIEARARVVRVTTRLVFMHGEATVEGEVVASASAVLKVLETRIPAP